MGGNLTIDHIIHLAGLIHDVISAGGTHCGAAGLKGMTVAQVRQLVMEGRRRRGG